MKKRPCVWRLDERTTVSMPRKRNTWVDAAFETGNGVLRLIVCSLSEMCRDRVNRYKWGRESFLEDTYWNAFPGSWRPLRCRAREVRRRRHLATTSKSADRFHWRVADFVTSIRADADAQSHTGRDRRASR